jgi:hypothetical protein
MNDAVSTTATKPRTKEEDRARNTARETTFHAVKAETVNHEPTNEHEPHQPRRREEHESPTMRIPDDSQASWLRAFVAVLS